MATEISWDPSEDDDVGWQPEISGFPRIAAVNNLSEALAHKDLSPGAVRAIVRAAVRPDDVRRKLADPVELRVQGGTLLVVETRLWTLGVWPHPANPREYGHRIYPLSDHKAAGTPLVFEPSSRPAGQPELEIRTGDPQALESRITEAKSRLIRDNPLFADIAAEGILQPLTVVATHVIYADGSTPSTLLIAADGSSRVSSAHRVLAGDDLSDHPTSYALANDDRAFRSLISPLVRQGQRSNWDDLSPRDHGRLRVLTLPARLIVGFRSDKRSGIPFHTAVRNFIGLTHIRSPKAYGAAVENEAKADAVLDALNTQLRTRPKMLTDAQKRWFAGTATPTQASRAGFPQVPDLRAAEIVWAILGGGRATAMRVNNGIRALTATMEPKREDRVDIAVELILRPLRTGIAKTDKALSSWRAVLQRAYLLPEISTLQNDQLIEDHSGNGASLRELRDQALDEIQSGHGTTGQLAPAQIELAVKAAYYMATSDPMALQRERFGGGDARDVRSAASVLRAMLSRTQGVYQAYSVIRAGRAGKPLPQVDKSGRPKRVGGEIVELTDDHVRSTYTSAVSKSVAYGIVAARQQWGVLNEQLEKLKQATDTMGDIPVTAGGTSLVSREGWDDKEVLDTRLKIDKISRMIGEWGDTYDTVQRGATDD